MATMIQHSLHQLCSSLSTFSISPISSNSMTMILSTSAKFRIYSCCRTPLVNGNPELRPSVMQVDTLQRHYAAQNPQTNRGMSLKLNNNEKKIKFDWAIQMGALAMIQVAEPAMAVTGVNKKEDLILLLLEAAVLAFGYFLIMPPIIMNWLRKRWYRRNLLEMYFQFMFVFIFFPGILVWAPFLNFRKFPRDPTLKNPWSKPENPLAVKGGFRKFPWATIEDYE